MAIEGAPDGIFVKDMNSRYVIVNRKFIEYKGAKSGAELLGKSAFDFLPKNLAAAIAAEDQELRSGRSSIDHRPKHVALALDFARPPENLPPGQQSESRR